MRLQTKSARAQFKAVADGPAGTFEAIVSVFGNVDLGGDRVVKGAFTKTLDDWSASGDPIPVIWSHEWDDPESHIGYVVEAAEREEGLYVKAQLDVDNNPRAAYVARLLKERRVREFSFGYFAKGYQDVDDPDYGTVRELTEIDLFEVGPTLLGMNPDTVLLEAASALSGSAKRMGRKTQENILKAYEALSEVVATITPDDDAKSVEPEGKTLPETKAVDVPGYVSSNAKRGLDYYEQGFGGDGLVDATIRAARDMASGSVSEEKVRKIGPWIARHLVDFDAPQNSDPDHEDYPGPGLVAHLLWGSGPNREGAERTLAWAEAETARLDGEDGKNTDALDADAPGDTQGTINIERLTLLLSRPQHMEE